jgi:hypothetical protein
LYLDGTIDLTTGAVVLSDGGLVLEGVTAADGNSLGGTFDFGGFISGTFTAVRAGDVDLIDLSGEWDVLLTGDLSDSCAVTVVQSWLEASAAVDCSAVGGTMLAGSANPLSGVISLTGELAGMQVEFSLYVVDDLSYLLGGWFIPTDPLGESGRAIAVPSGKIASGILAVDCAGAAEGIQSSCSYRRSEAFAVQLHVVAAPAEGYASIDGGLAWQPAILGVDLPSLEALFSDCALPLVTFDFAPVPPLPLNCVPASVPAEPRFTTGPAFQVDMTCDETGEAALTLLDDITGFNDEELTYIQPVLIDATVACYGPQLGGPGPMVGDANCDQSVSSVDAAVVLQYEAGLIGVQDCLVASDVNRDDRTNSIDAQLILQVEAGLIPRLPIL